MMKKILFTLLVLSATPAFALLSPLSQSIREIEKILQSRELPQYFHPNDTLVDIRREGNNYVVKSEEKQMVIEVIYLPPQKVGPREFKLVFHPATPL